MPMDVTATEISTMNSTESVAIKNSEVNREQFNIMQILQLLIVSVGIIGNLTVIVVFMNHRKLRLKIPNRFIVNQSILDFVISIVLLLTTLTVKDIYSVKTIGLVGYFECTLWKSQCLLWALFVSSTWNIVTMTFERYLELVHPLWHKAHFKIRWIYITLVTNVSLNIIFHASYYLPTTKVVANICLPNASWPSRLFSSAFGVFVICIQFIGPLVILIYCYGRIVWTLTRKIGSNLDKKERNISENESVLSRRFTAARNNTVKTFLLVGICFIICWVNDEVYYLMYNLGYDADWNGTYFKFCVIMVFLNCTVNPFVYLIKYQDYQEALKQFFTKEKHFCNISYSSSEITVTSTS